MQSCGVDPHLCPRTDEKLMQTTLNAHRAVPVLAEPQPPERYVGMTPHVQVHKAGQSLGAQPRGLNKPTNRALWLREVGVPNGGLCSGAGRWRCTHPWGIQAHQPQGAGSTGLGGPHLGLAWGRGCRQGLCLGARGLRVQNRARCLRRFLQRSENKCNANAGEWEAAGSRVSQMEVRSQAEAGPIWSLRSGSREDRRDRAGPQGRQGKGQRRRAARAAPL